MNATVRKAIREAHKQKHLEQLQALGYIYPKMNALRMIEHQANWYATQEANGELAEGDYDKAVERITAVVKRLFGGTLPKGFFVNGDPRGYALKLDDEVWNTSGDAQTDYANRPINRTDWGGYYLLAPESGKF